MPSNSINQQFDNSIMGNQPQGSNPQDTQNPLPPTSDQLQNSLPQNQQAQIQRTLQPQLPVQNQATAQAPQQPLRPVMSPNQQIQGQNLPPRPVSPQQLNPTREPVNSLINNNQPISNQHLGVVNQPPSNPNSKPQAPLTYEQKLQQNIPQGQNIPPRQTTPSQSLPPQIPTQNNQIPRPVNPQKPNTQANQLTNSQENTPTRNPQTREQYLTPGNINQQPAPKPQRLSEVKQIATQANLNNPNFKPDYNHLEQGSRVIQVNTYDILKLCIYIIPGLSLVILILRSIKDEEVMWHARQSLVAQGIWLFILTILNLINFPLISGNGFSLALIWNILLIGALIWAGAQAYMGKRWRIPLISEIGTVFIDGK